ncbi:indolepyruvate oxidoreductase subunit beta family protein [Limnohabitans sp. B9-3]|uniref:indolepyruvate oxidoreductase subunit beta family protein n=1 Tax=Limnohabitans sp. B9-3 TaxID=1100707 RepID=UPI000C1F8361|nr:indolepyruvate oxidoreductase subunit beta family protein [Limnohabitans sp. B9-3]PIT73013.1 indolepyruvate oxidoreductase [Limnohabitans sp. B9-3]
MTQPISILLCALGGEGGGVLADWLIDAARHAGYPAQATSIPGVAQRTGATTYYLEVFPTHSRELGGRKPVFGLNPLPGRLDLLVSSELLETARQISNGLSSADRTLLISASNRTLTTQEKMQMGDGRLDDAALVQLLQQHSRASHVLDMASLTRDAGTVVSAVMLGSIAASGVLPLQRADYEAAVANGKPTDQLNASQRASLRGFALAWDAVENQKTQSRYVDAVLAPKINAAGKATSALANAAPELPSSLASQFPAATHEMLALGVDRLMDYQGAAYVDLYVQRLRTVLATEPTGQSAVTQETARWLALWMAFDDIVRVSDLKSRASRWARVRGEVKAKDDDVVKLFDHFKPGIPEFAALLPKPLALTLTRWDNARVVRGKQPLAFPIKVGTHSVFGMVMLRLLASLTWLRVRGHRYAEEQALIDEWLNAVTHASAQSSALGLSLAQCGRLIKGYGGTHDRGRDNLLHILRHLAQGAAFDSAAERAHAIDQAREAALRDEAGIALDQTLRAHGAPAREVKAQPIRWMPRVRPSAHVPPVPPR